MTDAELVNAFSQTRDADAFARLVERYEKLVWSVCARQLPHRCDQEDAFQTTFLLLAKNVRKIRKPESLGSWLYGTARKVASRIRKQRASLPSLDIHAVQVTSSSPSAFELIARQHELDTLDRQIQAMPEKDRTPLILFYFAGFSVKQIANQLNLTPAATEGRIRRARARLRQQLRNEGIYYSPLALLAMANSKLVEQSFVQATVEKCVSAGVGVTAGAVVSTTTTYGAKMMICKGICAAGITLILTIGGLLGTSTTPATNEVALVAEASDLPQADIELTTSEVYCCPLMESVSYCCDVCSSAHANAGLLHQKLAMFVAGFGD